MTKIIAILLGLAIIPMAAEAGYKKKKYSEKHHRGLKITEKTKKFIKTAPRAQFSVQPVFLPSSASLRGKAGPVEDQGQCGSCWDFSLTSTLRGTLIQAGKDPGRLSFNYLLNCNTEGYSCDGGDFGAAQMFVSPAGAPAYGSDGPYVAQSGQCVKESPIAYTASFKILGGSYGGVPKSTFKDIAYIISQLHRPVAVDVGADDNWMNYESGVFDDCNAGSQINHMVVIEGYDCETAVKDGHCVFNSKGGLPKGVGTYLIRNSWNTTWGDDGYITMKASDRYGRRCNQIATDALYYEP